MVSGKELNLLGLSLIVEMRCEECWKQNHFSLLSNGAEASREWCAAVVGCGLRYSHLDEFCQLFGLHNLSESQFFNIQCDDMIPAIEAVVAEEREEWVKSHQGKTFEVLTDARHAAVVNSDHNTTTVVLHDIDEEVVPNQTKRHYLFTFNVPRTEASNQMRLLIPLSNF
jgi:hypothetical protein